MRSGSSSFFLKKMSNFTTFVVNFFIFLPYFFSVRELGRTLFSPWKNLQVRTKRTGFSLSNWFNDLSFNFTSRLVGSMVRGGLLTAFLLIEIFFVLLLPVAFVGYLTLLPVMYLFSHQAPSEKEKEKVRRTTFVNLHLLEEANRAATEAWYDSLSKDLEKLPWWHLKRLMSMPPLGRDFTAGYTPTLDQYSVELTINFDPNKILIGRDSEIAQIERILIGSEAANIILVGREGVGRHAIINTLAKRIFEGTANPLLA